MKVIDGLDRRRTAVYLARARFGIGLSMLAAPGLAGAICVGRRSDGRGARVFARLTGVREVALGAGASIAIGQGRGGGDWVSMLALCDAGDAVVNLLTPGLLVRARIIGVGAAASAVVHFKLAKDLAAAEAGEEAERDRGRDEAESPEVITGPERFATAPEDLSAN